MQGLDRVQGRAVLRWAGSKKQLLPTIAAFWGPGHRRYVEPFCGSASLFFRLQPAAALLSDLNQELIETLEQLQVSANRVAECLARLPSDQESYYRIRDEDPLQLPPTRRAARFLYLNHHCFNGLYRVNRQGKFNVPYCSSKKRLPLSAEELRTAGEILKRAALISGDFQDVVDCCGDGDFIYLDPPYASSSQRSTFIEYGIDGFSEMDIGRLFDSLDDASSRGAKFVLSYADVPEIYLYGRNFNIQKVDVRRNIAGFTGARRKVGEVLVTNVEVKDV